MPSRITSFLLRTSSRLGLAAKPLPRAPASAPAAVAQAKIANVATPRTSRVATAARIVFRMGSITAAGAAALYVTDKPMFEAYVRIGRCAFAAAVTIADYRATAAARAGTEPAASHALLTSAHTRGGERLRAACEANAGVYVKIGQHIALLDYLVPEPYLIALRPLFDCAPRTPWPAVREMVEAELGAPVETLFADFEREPIASASLAQVHRARGADGTQYAVKVQHPPLRQMARTEVALLAKLVAVIKWLEPSFGFEWLVEEVRLNLPLELDFRNEARNAARCEALLHARFGDVVCIPRVHAHLSAERVLTMDFETGVPAADARSVESAGLDSRAVARLLSQVWGEMSFASGWVHCDPHPGNVLVRARPAGGGAQLVLLDHGLYRQVSEGLRLQWARLWAAIVLSDEQEIAAVVDELGARSARMEAVAGPNLTFTLFAAMLTAKPYKAVAAGSLDALDVRALASDAGERAALAADVSRYAGAIIEILESVPRPLLLLLKVNDALRSAGLRLGARPSDTYIVTALESLRALRADARSANGAWARAPRVRRWRYELRLWRASLRISAYLVAEWWADVLDHVRAAFGSSPAPSRAPLGPPAAI
jgi:aarF domain-containing kinase